MYNKLYQYVIFILFFSKNICLFVYLSFNLFVSTLALLLFFNSHATLLTFFSGLCSFCNDPFSVCVATSCFSFCNLNRFSCRSVGGSRLDKHVDVPMPDIGGRKAILDLYAKKIPMGTDVDMEQLARGQYASE